MGEEYTARERELMERIGDLQSDNDWLRSELEQRSFRERLKRFFNGNQLAILIMLFGFAIFWALLAIRNTAQDILQELQNVPSVSIEDAKGD